MPGPSLGPAGRRPGGARRPAGSAVCAVGLGPVTAAFARARRHGPGPGNRVMIHGHYRRIFRCRPSPAAARRHLSACAGRPSPESLSRSRFSGPLRPRPRSPRAIIVPQRTAWRRRWQLKFRPWCMVKFVARRRGVPHGQCHTGNGNLNFKLAQFESEKLGRNMKFNKQPEVGNPPALAATLNVA